MQSVDMFDEAFNPNDLLTGTNPVLELSDFSVDISFDTTQGEIFPQSKPRPQGDLPMVSEAILELTDSTQLMAKQLALTMFKLATNLRNPLALAGASVSTFPFVFIAGSGKANSLTFEGTLRR